MSRRLVFALVMAFFVSSCAQEGESMVRHDGAVFYVKEAVGTYFDPVSFMDGDVEVSVFPLTDRDGLQIRGEQVGEEPDIHLLVEVANKYCQKSGGYFPPPAPEDSQPISEYEKLPNSALIFGVCENS